ncbi:hypothetical protein PS15m_005716 [Mucor circinelloides]
MPPKRKNKGQVKKKTPTIIATAAPRGGALESPDVGTSVPSPVSEGSQPEDPPRMTSLATLVISVNGHHTQIAAVLFRIVETEASLQEQNIHINSVLSNILERLQKNASNPRQQQGIVFSMPNEQNTSDLIKQPETVINEFHLKKLFEDHISKYCTQRRSVIHS